MRTILNVVWLLVSGLELALAYALAGVLSAVLTVTFPLAIPVTIIGIPFAVATLKMLPLALAPYGKDVVDAERARASRELEVLHEVRRPAGR